MTRFLHLISWIIILISPVLSQNQPSLTIKGQSGDTTPDRFKIYAYNGPGNPDTLLVDVTNPTPWFPYVVNPTQDYTDTLSYQYPLLGINVSRKLRINRKYNTDKDFEIEIIFEGTYEPWTQPFVLSCSTDLLVRHQSPTDTDTKLSTTCESIGHSSIPSPPEPDLGGNYNTSVTLFRNWLIIYANGKPYDTFASGHNSTNRHQSLTGAGVGDGDLLHFPATWDMLYSVHGYNRIIYDTNYTASHLPFGKIYARHVISFLEGGPTIVKEGNDCNGKVHIWWMGDETGLNNNNFTFKSRLDTTWFTNYQANFMPFFVFGVPDYAPLPLGCNTWSLVDTADPTTFISFLSWSTNPNDPPGTVSFTGQLYPSWVGIDVNAQFVYYHINNNPSNSFASQALGLRTPFYDWP